MARGGARRCVGGRELQGSASCSTCASASRSSCTPTSTATKSTFHGRIAGFVARHGRRLRAAAAAERVRQLDQDRAARAGAHRARPAGAGRASAARRALDARAGRPARPVRPGCWRRADAGAARRRCRPFAERDRGRRGDDRSGSSPKLGRAATTRWAPPCSGQDRAQIDAAGRHARPDTRSRSRSAPSCRCSTHDRQRVAADHRRQPRRQPDQGTWVITSFAVANGISVPLTGWLMRRYGVVRTFVSSVAAVHPRLVPVRHRLELRVADRLPRAAGRGLGPDDPGARRRC